MMNIFIVCHLSKIHILETCFTEENTTIFGGFSHENGGISLEKYLELLNSTRAEASPAPTHAMCLVNCDQGGGKPRPYGRKASINFNILSAASSTE